MTWRPTHEDPLLLLAFDHRASFAELFGAGPDPSGADLKRVEAAKEIVYDGLLRARGSVAEGRPGALVDEQYGSAVIGRARSDGVVFAVPIEASGRDWFEPVWGDDWRAHIERIRPDFAKVLVRDNPDFDADERAGQLARLHTVSRGLRDLGIPLIYELLVPASEQQLAGVGGNADRYDAEVRAGLTAQLIADNYAHDVRPALWKVEGLESVGDAAEVADAATAEGSDADLVVLGRDAPRDRLVHWLETAAQVSAFVGFAIGRSIWLDVVRGLPRDPDDTARERASAEIADRYLGFVAAWQGAAGGSAVGGSR